MWVDIHGAPLSEIAFSRRVGKLIKEWDPEFWITPSCFRRNIPTLLVECDVTFDGKSIQDSLGDYADLINTSTVVLFKYYIRATAAKQSANIQEQIADKLWRCDLSKKNEKELEQILADQLGLLENTESNEPTEPTEQRYKSIEEMKERISELEQDKKSLINKVQELERLLQSQKHENEETMEMDQIELFQEEDIEMESIEVDSKRTTMTRSLSKSENLLPGLEGLRKQKKKDNVTTYDMEGRFTDPFHPELRSITPNFILDKLDANGEVTISRCFVKLHCSAQETIAKIMGTTFRKGIISFVEEFITKGTNRPPLFELYRTSKKDSLTSYSLIKKKQRKKRKIN